MSCDYTDIIINAIERTCNTEITKKVYDRLA